VVRSLRAQVADLDHQRGRLRDSLAAAEETIEGLQTVNVSLRQVPTRAWGGGRGVDMGGE